jgi:hypothetical protein
MNDRREMILSFLVVIQGMSDNFRTLSELFPDFADLPASLRVTAMTFWSAQKFRVRSLRHTLRP